MKDNVLKKEFNKKDVKSLRNLVKGKASERTGAGVGYTKKEDVCGKWGGDGKTQKCHDGSYICPQHKCPKKPDKPKKCPRNKKWSKILKKCVKKPRKWSKWKWRKPKWWDDFGDWDHDDKGGGGRGDMK